MDTPIEKSLNSAFASARMEGFQITQTVEADCIKIVSGEISVADYIQRAIETNASGATGNR